MFTVGIDTNKALEHSGDLSRRFSRGERVDLQEWRTANRHVREGLRGEKVETRKQRKAEKEAAKREGFIRDQFKGSEMEPKAIERAVEMVQDGDQTFTAVVARATGIVMGAISDVDTACRDFESRLGEVKEGEEIMEIEDETGHRDWVPLTEVITINPRTPSEMLDLATKGA